MSQFYDEMGAVSLEMLTEFGGPATFKHIVAGTRVPGTGPTNTETSHSVVAAVFPVSAGGVSAGNAMLAGTAIRAESEMVLMFASATIPEPQGNDLLVIGSKNYKVLSCEVLAPAGQPVLYTLHVVR